MDRKKTRTPVVGVQIQTAEAVAHLQAPVVRVALRVLQAPVLRQVHRAVAHQALPVHHQAVLRAQVRVVLVHHQVPAVAVHRVAHLQARRAAQVAPARVLQVRRQVRLVVAMAAVVAVHHRVLPVQAVALPKIQAKR